MKILKIVGGVIGAVVVLALVIPIFTKKEYQVERSITIARPRAEVFAYLKLLRNQDNFSVWAKLDPNMKRSFRGTDGTVGFVSAWDSQSRNVGQGEQEIKAIDEGHRIDYELRFMRPMESKAPAYLILESVGEKQTKVTWGFKGSTPYPMNLMHVFMDVEAMVGKSFSTGLDSLKEILEKPNQK